MERSYALGSGQEAIALLVEITGQLHPREFFHPYTDVERVLGHPMGGARTGMQMLHKTRVFWVLTEEVTDVSEKRSISASLET